MAKVITSGTGSTRRTRRAFSTIDPQDQSPLMRAMKAFADTGDPFLAKLERIESVCRTILQAASIPCDSAAVLKGPRAGEEDTPEGYALRALGRLRHLRQFLASGNAMNAADFAFDLGVLLAEAGMKLMADDGFRSGVQKQRAIRNKTKVTAAKKAAIKAEAEQMIASGMKRKTVVTELHKKHVRSIRTIEPLVPSSRSPRR
jgi:hypothetical protein